MEYTQKTLLPTNLPVILVVEEQVLPEHAKSHLKYEFPAQLPVTQKKAGDMVYTLIARVEYSAEHYTALLMPKSKNYIYKFGEIDQQGKACPLEVRSRKEAMKQFTGVRLASTTAWYVLDLAVKAQTQYINQLRTVVEKTGATLTYLDDQAKWHIERHDFSSFLDIPSESEESSMTEHSDANMSSSVHSGMCADVQGDTIEDGIVQSKSLQHQYSAKDVALTTEVNAIEMDNPKLDANRTNDRRQVQSKRQHEDFKTAAEGNLIKETKKKVRPSYEKIRVPYDQPAAKEFLVDTSLQRRQRAARKLD